MSKNDVVGEYISDKKYIPLNVGQLKQLLEDVDDDKMIRVWVECRNKDGAAYLEGRKLAGITDEEDLCCLCAMYYRDDEQ